MLQGVIFDLGSTLIHTELNGQWEKIYPRMTADLVAHLHTQGHLFDAAAFHQHFGANYTAMDQQRHTDWIETTTAEVLTRTLADFGVAPLSPAAEAEALAAYYASSESLWQPMPGVYDVLPQLVATGYKLAIISNAGNTDNVNRLIDNAGLRRYFDPIIISSSTRIRKPAPKIFDFVLEPWGLPPQACAMVGDTLGADILGAQLAGMHNVWITTQPDRPDNRARRGEIIPEAEIATLADLPQVLAAF